MSSYVQSSKCSPFYINHREQRRANTWFLKTKESTLLDGSTNFWGFTILGKRCEWVEEIYIGFYIDVPLCVKKDEL